MDPIGYILGQLKQFAKGTYAFEYPDKQDTVKTKFGEVPFKGPDRKREGSVSTQPAPTMAPTATPAPAQSLNPIAKARETVADPNFRFAFETLPRDQYYTQNGPRPNFQPDQPPADIGNIIRHFFPKEATQAAVVAATENGTYDPKRPDNINKKDGSRDRGIFQINSGTFDGLMERQGDLLRANGINSYEDMYDPWKNAFVAKLIKEGAAAYQPDINPNGWTGWAGWQDTGYDINQGWYGNTDRGAYEMKKKGKK